MKLRADRLLVDRGLCSSRAKARAIILAGEVKANGRTVSKAGETFPEDVCIEVAERPRYVSRGGLKLEGALEDLGLDVSGLRAVDVGASTGGFTDCLLQHGAVSVAAVDVGYGQLAWSLRNDARVSVFERTNIRGVDPPDVGAPFDLAVIDVSFIGLEKVLPTVDRLVSQAGGILALVKPQFQVGRGRVGKGGVVRDADAHADALEAVSVVAKGLGWRTCGRTFSRITGPKGNIEFWVWLLRGGEETLVTAVEVVQRAHEGLGD